ncbi:MAG: nucleotide sugar dehydrogenase [Acidimicrobiales bacterium]|nr:nucleotide sugar dehydrogenase [Acidimicrobiales bacterium]RZV48047.1 MAG: nucleotide sugar dehydrogenase [Acidimicrobiales bacterium]
MENTRVVILGQGYVGLPLAMRCVEQGFLVVGFDVDDRKIDQLNSGSSPVEDISDSELAQALASGRYIPSDDPGSLAGFDYAIISVPTPLAAGQPDLSYIEAAISTIAPQLRPGCTVVLESTTYPGTTDELVADRIEELTGLRAEEDYHLGYSPERIDPGNPVWTLVNTPKVVSGVGPTSLGAVQWFYDQCVDKTVAVKTTREAELTKLLENTFRHVNIALVNELAMFAHDLDVDIWEVIDAAATKPFGFMKFSPGPGVGGHCLPVDPSYLSWAVKNRLGRTFRFVELANDINRHMPEYVVRRLRAGLTERESLEGASVLLVGMAYKPNTGDARESPSVDVATRLIDLGADVRVIDGHVDSSRLPRGSVEIDLTAAEVASAEAVIVLVDHDDIDLDLINEHASYVLDCRDVLRGENIESL